MDFLKPPPQYNRFQSRRNNGLWVGSKTAFTNPLSIAGCIGWYDFSDTSKIATSGANITGYTDKSTQLANLTDGGGTNKLQTGIITQNGLNAASNSLAASAFLTSAAAAYGAPGSFTIFGVVMSTSAPSSKSWCGPGLSGGGAASLFRNSGTNDFRYFENVGSQSATAAGGFVNNVWNVFEFDCQSGSGANVRSGLDIASGAAGWPARTLNTFVIGSSATDTLLGGWGEIIIYNSRLIAADRNNVQTYLKNKWNV